MLRRILLPTEEGFAHASLSTWSCCGQHDALCNTECVGCRYPQIVGSDPEAVFRRIARVPDNTADMNLVRTHNADWRRPGFRILVHDNAAAGIGEAASQFICCWCSRFRKCYKHGKRF